MIICSLSRDVKGYLCFFCSEMRPVAAQWSPLLLGGVEAGGGGGVRRARRKRRKAASSTRRMCSRTSNSRSRVLRWSAFDPSGPSLSDGARSRQCDRLIVRRALATRVAVSARFGDAWTPRVRQLLLQARAEDTRQTILDSAVALYLSRGAENTTVQRDHPGRPCRPHDLLSLLQGRRRRIEPGGHTRLRGAHGRVRDPTLRAPRPRRTAHRGHDLVHPAVSTATGVEAPVRRQQPATLRARRRGARGGLSGGAGLFAAEPTSAHAGRDGCGTGSPCTSTSSGACSS